MPKCQNANLKPGRRGGILTFRRSDVGRFVPTQAPDDASGHFGQRDSSTERRNRNSEEIRRVERFEEVLYQWYQLRSFLFRNNIQNEEHLS